MLHHKIIKRCPKGHRMEPTWRRCPKCTGRPPLDVAARDLSDATVYDHPLDEADEGTAAREVPASSPAPSRVVLVVTAGPLAGDERLLAPGTTKIGKAPTAGGGAHVIAIPDDRFLSREHAQLTLGGAALVLRDPGSTNGSFVNGARVSSAVLGDGDEVRMGESVFRIRIAG
jgi:pSer/pThr/pTyr-binding forkhead associated (FHA) protein